MCRWRENSKVKVIVGNEESAEKVEKYVCDLGYEKEILNIVIDSNFRPVPDGNAVCFGDLNSDQTIDVTDLTELSLALLGDKELTEDQQKAADIDGNGSVTLADLARLQQYLSKKIDSLRWESDFEQNGDYRFLLLQCWSRWIGYKRQISRAF